MTPSARIDAAIRILDRIFDGELASRAFARWGRENRFAGSKDRAAIQDHVFDALRRRRSYAALGGAADGRGVMIGALVASGIDPASMFTGERFAPVPLRAGEGKSRSIDPASAEALDLPDWLLPVFRASLGDQADHTIRALRTRAPVHLRVNRRKATREQATERLASEGFDTRPHPLSPTALVLLTPTRGLGQSATYRDGWVELQDASSQAAADLVALDDRPRVLDLCAGGGGKTLALAGRGDGVFHVHDVDPARMKDLPARARRAGIKVKTLATDQIGRMAPFDLVVVDAPCSGSGTWRRNPDAKWRLTPENLTTYVANQAKILRQAAGFMAQGGVLLYITCSLFDDENSLQIKRLLADDPRWTQTVSRQWTPLDHCDGMFAVALTLAASNYNS